MASTGATFPGTGANVDRGGLADWANPGRITADDGSTTDCNAGTASDYLVASNFGFSVPSDATINGVEVKAEIAEDALGTEVFSAQLQDDSAALMGAAKTATVSGSTLTVYTYGGAADLWSATITPAIVNDADFGVRLWFATSNNAHVDYVTLNVTYTEASGAVVKKLAAMGVG